MIRIYRAVGMRSVTQKYLTSSPTQSAKNKSIKWENNYLTNEWKVIYNLLI